MPSRFATVSAALVAAAGLAAAQPSVLFTTVVGSGTNSFDGEEFPPPADLTIGSFIEVLEVSQDGLFWVARARLDLDDDLIVLFGNGPTSSDVIQILREGDSVPGGVVDGAASSGSGIPSVSVGSGGVVAVRAQLDEPSASDDAIFVFQNGTFSLLVQEGNTIPAGTGLEGTDPDGTAGFDTLGEVFVTDTGGVMFEVDSIDNLSGMITSPTSGSTIGGNVGDNAIFLSQGGSFSVLTQVFADAPTGGPVDTDGFAEEWNDFDVGSIGGDGFAFNNGTLLIFGDTFGNTFFDQVVTVDGQVFFQEGTTPPGFSRPLGLGQSDLASVGYNDLSLSPGGSNWLASIDTRASGGNPPDSPAEYGIFVNGAPAVRDGDPVPGSSLFWLSDDSTETWSTATVDDEGDLLLTGFVTTDPATGADRQGAIVFLDADTGGATFVAVEGEQVDVTGDGVVDDAFLDFFRPNITRRFGDFVFFVADLANASGDDIGQGFYAIPLTDIDDTAEPADFNQDGVVDVFDLIDFLVAFSNADPAGDFNGDGGVDVLDLIDFLVAFAGA